jgi:hypothetical protein
VPVPVAVARGGDYDVWLQGSFARGATVALDGRAVGTARDELSFAGQWIHVGVRRLAAGRHTALLSDPGGGLRPGGGRQPQQVGPLALVPRSPRPVLVTLAPARAGTLCARALDWLAVVAAP